MAAINPSRPLAPSVALPAPHSGVRFAVIAPCPDGVAFAYQGTREALLAAGAAEPAMLAPVARGQGCIDSHGFRYARRPQAAGELRILRVRPDWCQSLELPGAGLVWRIAWQRFAESPDLTLDDVEAEVRRPESAVFLAAWEALRGAPEPAGLMRGVEALARRRRFQVIQGGLT